MGVSIIKQFEYLTKIFRITNQQKFTNELNEYGIQGWETASIEKVETNVYQIIFKREIIIQ